MFKCTDAINREAILILFDWKKVSCLSTSVIVSNMVTHLEIGLGYVGKINGKFMAWWKYMNLIREYQKLKRVWQMCYRPKTFSLYWYGHTNFGSEFTQDFNCFVVLKSFVVWEFFSMIIRSDKNGKQDLYTT